MVALPKTITSPTVAAIYAGYEKREAAEPRRGHLGASVIGRPCERQLWYAFRWAYQEQFEGRMLRLFQRGHREEDWFAADLRSTGAQVHSVDPRTGQQFRFSAVGGHVGGSMDGCALGLLEAPKTWHVVEYKTHGSKSFAKLEKEGVQKAKPEHWAQMQLYMRWSGMDRAFYLAVNKDTDALHAERIHAEAEAGERLESKAERIVKSAEPLPKLSDNPAWFECKFCPAFAICHGGQLPDVNCRTCVHATPEMDGSGRWSCALHKRDLPLAEQAKGCPSHRYIPALVTFAEPVDADPIANWVEYRMPDGRIFRNGDRAPGSYGSEELRVMDRSMIGDAGADALRAAFDGKHIAVEKAA